MNNEIASSTFRWLLEWEKISRENRNSSTREAHHLSRANNSFFYCCGMFNIECHLICLIYGWLFIGSSRYFLHVSVPNKLINLRVLLVSYEESWYDKLFHILNNYLSHCSTVLHFSNEEAIGLLDCTGRIEHQALLWWVCCQA